MEWLKNTRVKWLLGFFVCVLLTAYFHQGKKVNGVIWSDQEGYYIYLPAVFINGGFENLYCFNGCTEVQTENGERIFTKYTYGVALLESPFFLVAHAVAPVLGYDRDGRTLPYIWAVMIAAIVYMLLGLFLLGKLLRELKFGETVDWLVPLGILLGTNLFYYTFREAVMSHVYSFFLFSVLIYSSHRKWHSDKLVWDVLSAVSLAIIVLIRPTNAIAILIPILWGVDGRNFLLRLKDFITDYRWIAIFSVACIVFFLPQLMYWKAMTGSYLFYSYGSEGFLYWNSPKMVHVLLSPQNGWLVYSPMVIIGLFGIGLMAKNKTTGWVLPAALLTLATYVFGSWWAWWFGGAFGHRCYVDFLPLLAVPSAVAVSKILSAPKWFQRMATAALILAVYVNIRMTDIYHGMWDGPNWGWYNYLEKLANVFYL